MKKTHFGFYLEINLIGIVLEDKISVKVKGKIYPIYYKSLIDKKFKKGESLSGSLVTQNNIMIGSRVKTPLIGEAIIQDIKGDRAYLKNMGFQELLDLEPVDNEIIVFVPFKD